MIVADSFFLSRADRELHQREICKAGYSDFSGTRIGSPHLRPSEWSALGSAGDFLK
jgi:hypothetical protein